MRWIFLIMLVFPLHSLNAQSPLDYNVMNYRTRSVFNMNNSPYDSSRVQKKWQLSKFGGLSTGYSFFNGGTAGIISAPIGLQLTHPLNKNLYAFAAISAAPAYFNFNSSFGNPLMNTFYPGSMASGLNQFGWYQRAEAGLMYINDEKTFSISGSIHMDRIRYPQFPAYTPPRK